jgi:gliding motility-associated protein GldL
MANKRKKFLPDNVIELMFGVGASIVIIGALLKITHQDFGPITGNNMLTLGLITEAIIFAISGVQGYMTGDSQLKMQVFKQ